jgi:hypothetical protein
MNCTPARAGICLLILAAIMPVAVPARAEHSRAGRRP